LGAKVLDLVSERLQQELPGLRGFSGENLKRMRRFYSEWSSSALFRSSATTEIENLENAIWSSVTTELQDNEIERFISVPFTHHYEIILKIKDENQRWYYINKAAQEFWTVRHLRTELKNQSHSYLSNFPLHFSSLQKN